MKKLHMGVLVLIMCFVVAISGCTNSSNSGSGSGTGGNNSSGNATNSNDVNIVIQYPGSWACDVSGTFGYRSLSGTGDQTNSIGSVSGAVTAAARKTEGGTQTLIVSITKGGKTLATASTNSPWGGASAVATGV